MSKLSETYKNYLAPEALIWIDEKKLSAEGIYFSNLEVVKQIDGADSFSFSISDAISFEFEPKYEKLFDLGKKVEIHIGYADSQKERSELSMLFVGLITAVNWNFGEENFLDISVEGEDYSFLLMKKKYEAPMQEESISNAVQKILDEVYQNVFDKVKIEPTSLIYPQIVNQKESDYLFMDDWAKRIGYQFYIENKNFYFIPMPTEEQSVLTLHYGQEILSFTPELSIEKEIEQVRVVGLEFSSENEPIVGEANLEREADDLSSDAGIRALLRRLNSVKYEVHEAVKSEEEATQRAESLLAQFSQNFFRAELKSVGIPELKAGVTITLLGLGKRFSRDYYVEKAQHSFSEQGYETSLTLRGSSSSFSQS